MKKSLILLLVTLAVSFSLVGCKTQNIEEYVEQTPTSTPTPTRTEDVDIVENVREDVELRLEDTDEKSLSAVNLISEDLVEGITVEEATNLCVEKIGRVAEETGFTFSYGCIGAIEYEGVQYYVMRTSWLVDNNHLSYVGDIMVSASGDEIYDGDHTMDNKYYLVTKRWSE